MAFRGSKSRNKVSVGEPAEGSKGLLEERIGWISRRFVCEPATKVKRDGGGVDSFKGRRSDESRFDSG